eukprot:12425919-Karenia_brevis.AAC.1
MIYMIYPNLRQELTDKSISLHLRLKLFNAVITPTVLYGCSSWVMTCTREASLRSAQMQMLRKIIGRKRIKEPHGDLETWVAWVQRVTEEARQAMDTHSVPDWVDVQRLRKQLWKDRLEDMHANKWAKQVFDWTAVGWRARGHPRARCAD